MDKTFVVNGCSNHSNDSREENDFYATDPKSVKALLDVEKFSKTIMEPCCGMGHICEELIKNGHDVIAFDLIDRGYGIGGVDFFEYTDPIDMDIITNPPFKLGLEFIEHALDLVTTGHKVAMFLKLTFLESKKRQKLFNRKELKTIYVFINRALCGKNGEFPEGSAVAYAWYIWEKGYNGDPVIKWI